MTPGGAGAVAACLAFKPALRRLNLRENELEDEGAVTIARVGVGRAGAWASVRVSVGWAVLG